MPGKFAWPQYRRAWDLSIEAPAAHSIDPVLRRIGLDGLPNTEIELRFRLETTESKPNDVSGPSAFVLISSSSSNTRLPVPLAGEGDSFVGAMSVQRDLLAGSVDLVAQVLDHETGRLIGESETWKLVVDKGAAPRPPGAPPFPISWISFSDKDAPAHVRAASQSLWLMDLTGPKPALLLNTDVRYLQVTLEAQRPQLERRRLRDNLAAQASSYALSALFREAYEQVTIDDGEITLPDDRLLRDVCESIAGEVDSVPGAEELFRHLKEKDSFQRQARWMEIDAAIQRLTNYTEAVARSVEEVFVAKN